MPGPPGRHRRAARAREGRAPGLASTRSCEAPTSVVADELAREGAAVRRRCASCFDWAFEEVMFSAAIWSSNQDPLRPEGHLHHPARARGRRAAHPRDALGHRQPRLDLPGHPDLGRRALRDPRAGRRAPDDRELLHAVGRQHGHRGRAQRPRPVTDADGSFVITVDADPAGGRPNHVQSTPAAHEFYIRDVHARLGPRRPQLARDRPPRRRASQRRPLTRDEQAERTAEIHAQVRRLQPASSPRA